ncbi:YdeI/OmpD-associated family protein [Paenibacillus rigui]|uniref:Bacteriocin-protection protein n=1 Tax=Paenibacillus rigui TaxID=554312 RepID=A0A229UVY8_9BACL|nr:YdeI/OmpD-associated family protein [Paenibacillus rigui]OXM87706.1 bacteriocin-protection protein [Paenibacillus rigui]
MTPQFFTEPGEFGQWLEQHHNREQELWVGYYKKGAGKPTITWPESVDEALCYGWIDGLRKSLGAESYMIRFTPRKPRSIWSVVNMNRVEELKRQGRMKPEGLRAYELRSKERSAVYSFEQKEPAKLSDAFEERLRANPQAWSYFQAQAPWYRKTAIHWVMSAKKEETRAKRLAVLIEDSEQGRTIPSLSWKKRE